MLNKFEFNVNTTACEYYGSLFSSSKARGNWDSVQLLELVRPQALDAPFSGKPGSRRLVRENLLKISLPSKALRFLML